MGPADPGPREGRPSFPSVPLDSEQARAFLQHRLSLFAKVATLLSLGFWAVQNIVMFIAEGMSFEHLTHGNNLVHVAGMAWSGLLWWGFRTGVWSARALSVGDVAGTIALCVIYTSMTLFAHDPERADIILLLVLLVVLVARAVFVPSTARRTAWISAVAIAPGVAVGTWVSSSALEDPAPLIFVLRGIYVLCWATLGVILATVASRTIFGLSERVREAVQLGQYTLLHRIGGGGMGEVYEARHALLRRPTAIKLIRPDRVGEEALRRFEREVTLTARLTHPNTIAIYDYGRTAEGVFYYAMEYLNGVDLQDLIDQDGPLPPGRVVHVLEQLCASLAEAHELGMVHRDVKPANVVLCRRGRARDVVKVLDFGLVKELDRGGDAALTQANSIAGTPLYMAPEAITAPGAVDARADLYAIGAVGFFLLAGQPPFLGSTVVEVCAKHMHAEPPRPSDVLGCELPRDLEDVLLGCLAKDADDRPQTADALRRALLDTSPARTWSEEEATRWWEEREARRSAEPEATTSPDPLVLSVELSRRGGVSDSALRPARSAPTEPARPLDREPRARR